MCLIKRKHFVFRCEADPETLTKYVLALIRKDKPVEELKESMPSQMEVFLQSETKAFVELLFKQLESKDYIRDFSDIENSKANSGVADSTTPKAGDIIKDPVYKPTKKPIEVFDINLLVLCICRMA